MSAFLCTDAHICAVAAYAAATKRIEPSRYTRADYDKSDAELIAARLHAVNVESVKVRYSHRKEAEPLPFRFSEGAARAGRAMSPEQAIKAAQCLAYQCDEHGVSEDGLRYVREVTETVIQAAIERLPGYESAAWALPYDFGRNS